VGELYVDVEETASAVMGLSCEGPKDDNEVALIDVKE
jgi:hypothetical protein